LKLGELVPTFACAIFSTEFKYLSLTLFVPLIFADHPYDALAPDDLALRTNLLH
jgi:hypothetical protein